MKEIASALVRAQKTFGPALKTSTNPHFRNRYADLAACVEAVIGALNSNGIALLQPCHESETGVTVETVFLHESGESYSAGRLHVPASKQDAQGYGSALTYARRYSLMAACGIAPEDDDGNAASKKAPEPAPVAAYHKISLQQASEIQTLLQSTGSDTKAFLEWISKGAGVLVTSVDAMPSSAYAPSIKQLKSKQKEPA